jgi:hypothetical protein
LLSALTLAALTIGIAAAAGASHAFAIAEVVAATVFVVNFLALCLAVTRREADSRVVLSLLAEPRGASAAHARAS